MLFTDSRYASGRLTQNFHARTRLWHVSVMRTFPNMQTDYFLYTTVEGDRVDALSYRFFGTSAIWWKIMDFNPEVINPHNIPVGTVLRIPNVR
jgi:phage tail protein X